jgi:hypothetical protein
MCKYVRILDGTNGIKFTSSAGGYLWHTDIYVTGVALQTSYWADPWVASMPACCGGYNVFNGGDYGLKTTYYSTAYAGTSTWDGNNHFCEADNYIVAGYSSSTAYVYGDYWPSGEIDWETEIYTGGSANVYGGDEWGASSCTPPASRVVRVGVPGLSQPGPTLIAGKGTTGETVLTRAVDLVAEGMGQPRGLTRSELFAEAAAIFERVIEVSAEPDDIPPAMLGLLRVFKHTGDFAHLRYLANLAAVSGPKQAAAIGALVQAYQFSGDEGVARSLAESLIRMYPDTEHETSGVVGLFWMDFFAGDYQSAELRLLLAAPTDESEAAMLTDASLVLSQEFGRPPVDVGSGRSDMLANKTSTNGRAGEINAMIEVYPNPFNPSTTIQLGLEAEAWTEVTVFDAVGRQLAVLHHGNLEAGNHTVRWVASGHPSGTYFVVVRTGSTVTSLPIVLQK